MIKDILYVMLSSSDDVRGLTTNTAVGQDDTGCGDDGSCFDRAFRLCKPTTFNPDANTIVDITGLVDNVCVLKAKLAEGKGPPAGTISGINPPYEMTCKIKDYALGMKGPEDILRRLHG
jgi:hypothetical protein